LERVDQLLGRWRAFTARGDVRLLIWELCEPDVALVDAFVARENEPDAARTADVIVELQAPFGAGSHGVALARELHAQFAELGQPCAGGDVSSFLHGLRKLRDQCWPEGARAKLAVWLRPSRIEHAAAYRAWLEQLIERAPQELRFLIVGDDVHLVGPRVVRERCQLDVLSALAATVQKGELAHAQVRLAQCLQCDDAAGAERITREAIALAEQQGKRELAGLLALTLAGGFASEKRTHEALCAYASAERASAACADGLRTRMIALFGQASLLLGEREYRQAAQRYETAAACAQDLRQPNSELDGWRLAAWCHERSGNYATAWECALRALALSRQLDQGLRLTHGVAS
jgi:tetratricopeptide (TPR) repeat protein